MQQETALQADQPGPGAQGEKQQSRARSTLGWMAGRKYSSLGASIVTQPEHAQRPQAMTGHPGNPELL